MTHLSFLVRIVFVLVLALPGYALAQCLDFRDAPERTNAGLEFLLCFQDNDASNDTEPDVYQEIYVASTGKPATVQITSKHEPTLNQTITLGPNESRTYRISDARGYMMLSTLVSEQVIKVKSDNPIVCYGLNHKHFSADAFMALPRAVAGNEFRVLSYRNSRRQPVYPRPSQFAVAAFEDNTRVTIIPTAPTLSGQAAGTAYEVTLNEGEGLHVQAVPTDEAFDLTGTVVRSTKPITVYAGHSRSEIPSNSGTSSDHLAETLPPVHTWGKKFIVAEYPFPGTTQPDLVRVLALNNDTRVSINGNEWITLGENQYSDTLYKGNLQIEATGPVLVGTYAHTTGDGLSTQLGDPFFVIAPPLEQTYTDYTFFNSDDPIYLNHFAIVVSETSAKATIELDGELVPVLAFRDLPPFTDGKQYSIARIGLSKGFHKLKTSNFMENGMVVMAYGIGFIDSYGYTAASLYRPTNSLRAVEAEHSAPDLPRHKNELIVENITDQTVYFESVSIELDADASTKYSVKLRENVIFDVRTLGRQEQLRLHLDVSPPLTEQITGKVRFGTSTSKWEGLYPSVAEFSLRPEAQASVDEFGSHGSVNVLHTPQNGLIIELRELWGSTSVKLYDALGRRIKSLADGVTISGERSFVIQKDELPAGYYVVEVRTGDSPSVRKGFTVSR